MKTWRPEQLTRGAQTLVREKLAVEYAPGRIAAADLAATPAMRARLVCPLLPDARDADRCVDLHGMVASLPTQASVCGSPNEPPSLRRLPRAARRGVFPGARRFHRSDDGANSFRPARARRARRRRRMRHTPYARRPQPGRSAAAQQTRKAASGRALRPKGGQGTGSLHRGNEVA